MPRAGAAPRLPAIEQYRVSAGTLSHDLLTGGPALAQAQGSGAGGRLWSDLTSSGRRVHVAQTRSGI
jgi:hypothetical protein